jgi:leader peptidase (prepilin peptidase)/N-methyltransferase
MSEYFSLLQTVFNQWAGFYHTVLFLVGATAGSFLNVFIYRFPIMLFARWSEDCVELNNHMTGKNFTLNEYNKVEPTPNYCLSMPGSHCLSCKSPIEPWHSIPILSWFVLLGKCASCGTSFSFRYPIIELLTAITTVWVGIAFGPNLITLAYLLLLWVLIAASFIDIDHQLLPDELIIPMIWFGLTLSLTGLTITPEHAIVGAATGYLSLWSIFQLFKLTTDKEGMGYGDFKLMATFGAFMGWKVILPFVVLSALVGTIITIFMVILKKLKNTTTIPFGPYITTAGLLVLLKGNEVTALYSQITGIKFSL